ncbi:hypothetical protein NCC49_000083 [Naganishia albida]|nr:hypothetical protein NCC49_000083 [Naganishia albida]
MPNTRPITEIDVLIHYATVASSPNFYIPGERIFNVRQSTQTKRKPQSEGIAPTKRRKPSLVKLDPKVQSQAISLNDVLLEQLDGNARREGSDPLANQLEKPGSPAQAYLSRACNILPTPPPLSEELPTVSSMEEDPPSTDPRPTWSFTTTPLPPHLKRQAQLHSPAATSTISEEDISEVDELATPGKDGTVTADTSGEGGALTGSPGGKLKHTEAGGTLLSLPRRLWSSIRPGLTL